MWLLEGVSVSTIHPRAYIVTLNSRNMNEVRFWNTNLLVICDNRRIKISRQLLFRFERLRFLSYKMFVHHFSVITQPDVMIYSLSIQNVLNTLFFAGRKISWLLLP